MTLRTPLLVATFLISALSTAAAATPEKQLRVCTGISANHNVFSKLTQPFEAKTGIKLVFTNKNPKGDGSDAIYKQVDSGEAEVGFAATTWDNLQDLLKQEKYPAKNAKNLHYATAIKDLMQIITYKKGPASLSMAQIHDLLVGKVKNWKAVGGEDLPVKLVTIDDQRASSKFIEQYVLDKQPLTRENVIALPEGSGVAKLMSTVASTPGAIAFTSKNAVTDDVNAPKHDDIGRPILVMYIGKPSPAIGELLNFIRIEGPKYGVK